MEDIHCEGQEQTGAVNPSRETTFIRFVLWLLEACWRICSQTTKQTRAKRHACEWIQMSPYDVFCLFVFGFFLNEMC